MQLQRTHVALWAHKPNEKLDCMTQMVGSARKIQNKPKKNIKTRSFGKPRWRPGALHRTPGFIIWMGHCVLLNRVDCLSVFPIYHVQSAGVKMEVRDLNMDNAHHSILLTCQLQKNLEAIGIPKNPRMVSIFLRLAIRHIFELRKCLRRSILGWKCGSKMLVVCESNEET